jgi:hypothetical protein
MGLAQAVASLQIHASNRRLFDQMAAVAAAGYLPVPGTDILPGLLNPATAVAAGLFFTLSLGAGLALLSAAAGWWCSRQALAGRWAVAAPVALQVILLLLMNSRGFDPWVSLYAVLIPVPVFWITRRFLAAIDDRMPQRFWLWRALPLVLLSLGWATQYDRYLFIDLRDHLLWSNTAGRAVNAFYYRYTLYAAEVFKSLDQRVIRTMAWPAAEPPPADVRRDLIRVDYLPVAAKETADLELRLQGDRLQFARNGRPLMEVAIERFRSDPRGVLAEVSDKTDPWPIFRAFTFFGVLLAFPIALYCLLFAGLRLAVGLVGGGRWADPLSALACLLIGFGLLAFFHSSRAAALSPADVGPAIVSESWQTRMAALKMIRERRLDVCGYPGYPAALQSPHPQERYWLARALAASSSPAASAGLAALLDDPDINVRTQALEAIAHRQDRSALSAVMNRLKTSPDWYFQLYAYRALRALGWNQTVSR